MHMCMLIQRRSCVKTARVNPDKEILNVCFPAEFADAALVHSWPGARRVADCLGMLPNAGSERNAEMDDAYDHF